MDVGDWMGSSKLMVNPDKTEDLLFGIKLHQKERMKYFPTKLLHHKITPTDSARSLESCLMVVNFIKNIYRWLVVRATINIHDLRLTYVACVGV